MERFNSGGFNMRSEDRQRSRSEQMDKLANNKESGLPPRHTKHGKMREASQRPEVGGFKQRSFPFILILLWSLISIILFIIVFWFYQEGKLDFIFNARESVQQEQTNGNYQPSMPLPAPTVPTPVERNPDEQGQGEEEEGAETPHESENNIDPSGQTSEDNQPYQMGQGETISQESEKPSAQERDDAPAILAEHVVQPGETMFSIVMKYYQTRQFEEDLAAFNHIEDKTQIKSGMKLLIPDFKGLQ
jgi:LysM repeat protein